MKTSIKTIFIACISVLTISSCNPTSDPDPKTTLNTDKLVKVEGGKYYGGNLKANSITKFSSLFPPLIIDVYSQNIASQIFEGLLKYNQKTLEIEPCVAKSYTINKTNTIYTFKLRNDVKFHNNDCFTDGIGRGVTAEDFKYTFEFLCSKNSLNKSGYLISELIRGAKDFKNGLTNTLEGIRVIDDYTIEIELKEAFSGFINILALTQTAVIAKEAVDTYGEDIIQNPVGSGPYKMTKNDEIFELTKSDTYWKFDEFGNQLPFIPKITISFEKNKTAELKSFNNGDLDFVWGVPVDEIQNIMGTLDEAIQGKNREFKLQSINSLQIQYFGFNLDNEIFKDKKVRQALNYALNKDSIVNYILQGEGSASKHGIIPKMQTYNNETIKGYQFDSKKAQQLIANAGYPNGKNFPSIELPYSASGQVSKLLATYFKNQIKAILNIDVILIETDPNEIIKQRENGEINFWRYGWIADYPDPSNFISQFHSKYIIEGEEKSYNFTRYSNTEFDKYLDKATYEVNDEKKMQYYLKAEQILVDDAVFIPIYFASEIRLVNPQLINFPINEIEFRDFSVSYFTPKSKGKIIRVYDNL